jgi:hypothetical protein
MATSKCVLCKETRFEVKAIEARHAPVPLVALQCAACGGVAGVLEAPGAAARLAEVEARLERLERAVLAARR